MRPQCGVRVCVRLAKVLMLRTITKRCELPKEEADALNRASGAIYTQVMVTHWRVLRQTGHWLSPGGAEKLNDWQCQQQEQSPLLHAHSVDAAQQAFYKACKTARANKRQGREGVRYPFQRKWYRTTVWKSTGIRVQEGKLLFARARGLEPVCVAVSLPGAVKEARLVYDLKQHGYFWHFVVEDGHTPVPVEGGGTAAIDLGEIHPVAITDGKEVCVVSCRELRSIAQQTNKELAKINAKLSRCKKNIRRARRLKRAKRKMLARQKRRRRDLEHKVSRATVQWCQEKNVGTLAIGDVRDVADKTKQTKRLGRHTRQKVSNWSHGTVRKYLGYKAEAAGITVNDKAPEAYTSQHCLRCGNRYKPQGRVYCCPKCRFRFPRDGVGCANILSRVLHEQLGQVRPVKVTYRRPFQKCRKELRSLADP
jgi:putative transposase